MGSVQRHPYLRLDPRHLLGDDYCLVRRPSFTDEGEGLTPWRFTFGLSAVFWLHLNKGKYFSNWKKTLLFVLNALLIIQSLFMNAAGLWSSITELIDIFDSDSSQVRGAFSCGDNSAV